MKPIFISTNVNLSEPTPLANARIDFKSRTANFFEAFAYLIASALALAIDFATFSGLIRLFGVSYQVAAVVGFSLGLVAIYILSIRFVFRNRSIASKKIEFLLFAGIGAVGLLLNSVILFVTVDKLHITHEISKVISAGLIFCFNFASRKFALFNSKGN